MPPFVKGVARSAGGFCRVVAGTKAFASSIYIAEVRSRLARGEENFLLLLPALGTVFPPPPLFPLESTTVSLLL